MLGRAKVNGNLYELERLPYIIHGGDYNPDQWPEDQRMPMMEQDIRLMKKAGINCATVGVFSWAGIERQEGKFDFSWLDDLLCLFEKNQMKVILATPSAAMPAWMARKYPEVLRTPENRIRDRSGTRRVSLCNEFQRRRNHSDTSERIRGMAVGPESAGDGSSWSL